MIRKIIPVVFVASLLWSCGNSGKKEVVSGPESPDEAIKVEFTSLAENPDDFIGKKISVEGKVVHVCMQSGKKMFITGEDPDVRLFISAGEEMSKFPMELLGSEIVVEGTLTKSEVEYLNEVEGMDAEDNIRNTAESDSCETENAVAKQSVMSDLMMVYNKHTVVK